MLQLRFIDDIFMAFKESANLCALSQLSRSQASGYKVQIKDLLKGMNYAKGDQTF